MAKKRILKQSPLPVRKNELVANSDQLTTDFEAVYDIIASHRDRVVKQVNGETVMMVWEVGGYVFGKLKTSAWGSGVVRQLSEYIHTQDPTVRGWSYRTIYKMVQFYETYSSLAFIELVDKVKPQIVPLEMAQIPSHQIVPIQSAQIQPAAIVPIHSSFRFSGKHPLSFLLAWIPLSLLGQAFSLFFACPNSTFASQASILSLFCLPEFLFLLSGSPRCLETTVPFTNCHLEQCHYSRVHCPVC